MYKLILCLRYLRTRYLAFVCIVSVMLGVATLIVVNAVMSGFSTKLKDRLHGVLSDVVMDTDRMDGFPPPTDAPTDPNTGLRKAETPAEMIARIMASPAGERIAAISPTVEVFAILQFQFRGQTVMKPVRLIGVEPAERAAVGGFAEYLVRQAGSPAPTFDLTPEALQRHEWNRRQQEEEDRQERLQRSRQNVLHVPGVQPVPEGVLNVPGGFMPVPPPGTAPLVKNDPFTAPAPDMELNKGLPPAKLNGAVLGYTIAHFRFRNEKGEVVEEAALKPGDAVSLTTVGVSDLRPVWGTFLVADYLKTEMSEYDQSFVYVPIETLQAIRGMGERCTALQIKLKDYARDKELVTRELRKLYPYAEVRIATWEEHQGPLLAAIDVERGILNLLLFMIVGVAGFSILAIFTMIVSEKFRDIGILKSLGASSNGVMAIFLGYGLLLGVVGCALGTGLGLWITENINGIEAFLTRVTGTAVFPRDVYYFKEIPTNVDPLSVALVNLGAVAIAVVFSLLPAYRAARLHPVRALRFE